MDKQQKVFLAIASDPYPSPTKLSEKQADEDAVLYLRRCLLEKDAALLFCYDPLNKIMYKETTKKSAYHMLLRQPDYRRCYDKEGRERGLELSKRYIKFHHIMSSSLAHEGKVWSLRDAGDVAVNVGPAADTDLQDYDSSVETDMIVGGMSANGYGYELVVALLGAFQNALLPHRSGTNDFHVFFVSADPRNRSEVSSMHYYSYLVLPYIEAQASEVYYIRDKQQ